LFGRLSGIQTQSGQTKINPELTAKKFSPNWKECRPCPVFACRTLAFALQLRKKDGKTCQGKIVLHFSLKNVILFFYFCMPFLFSSVPVLMHTAIHFTPDLLSWQLSGNMLPTAKCYVSCRDIRNVKMYFISSPVKANIECQAILKTYELFVYGYTTLLIQFVKEVY